MEEKLNCPWCGKEFKRSGISHHMRSFCKEKPNITDSEITECIINTLCKKNVIKDIINDYNNLFSLPDLYKKYGINYKLIIRLLKDNNIKIRNISESAKQISVRKIKKFYNENYGVDNPSQLEIIKEKKKNTFIKHYGVDNIWKTEEFKQFSRNLWNSYNEEEKHNRLIGFLEKRQYGRVSNLEKKVLNILHDIGIDYEAQFKFKNYYHKYDAKITNSNILIEINGDFWHANPSIYKEDDILNFSKTNKPKAKDIWEKDEKNIKYAEEKRI